MHRCSFLLAAVASLAICRVAIAWNAFGHKVVAEIAWQHLDDATRQKIVDVLYRHPRFAEDFVKKMPEDVATADKSVQDHWVFQQAAIWPDLARKTEYDQPKWHYIDIPFVPDGERPVSFPLSTSYSPKSKEECQNVSQAAKYCVATVSDPAVAAEAKALSYSWLMHLVGDMHQPLHSTALVCDYFPDGDEGGNKLPVIQGKNLHSLWDNLLGRQSKMNDVEREVAKLKELPELWQVDTKLDIDGWIAESHDIATSFTYSPAILQAVRDTKLSEKIEPISLDEDYLRQAGQIARRRIAAAGIRLATVLGQTGGN
jgi:hypothetical protein